MGGVTCLGVCCCPLSSFPWLLDICQAAMLSLLHSPLARDWGEYFTQLHHAWQTLDFNYVNSGISLVEYMLSFGP